MGILLRRARCALIGHHVWAHAHDYIGTDDPCCQRCGTNPPPRRRSLGSVMPIWITRRRWKLSVRVGLPRRAYVNVSANLGSKRFEEGPEIEASLVLWRLYVYAWLGGFQWTSEDADHRQLVGVACSVVTHPHEFHQIVCRFRGHVPKPSEYGGYVFCDRCESTLERPERIAVPAD